MTLWVISDTHFGHGALIGAGRDFASVKQMDECIADNWNDSIGRTDTVFHLGDVYQGDGWQILKGLNGHKKLILGNHDDPRDAHLTDVFTSISLWEVFEDAKVALTHLPMDLSDETGLGLRFQRNIHGHLHHRPAPTSRHVCLSVEQTGYRPVGLEKLFEA
ncbi:MAG: metallophosphoesterase family protein [Epibacterium sp.]|nr:metallophosphoesterase family protein [Epibacterium sp.]NQX76082.1 metallophosphoesterase [Epibacterium sp.]